MARDWHQDGLRFSCTQCGECCTGAPGYVWVTRAEVARLAAHLELSVEDFGARYLRRVGSRVSLREEPNGDCVFYRQGCTVYPARPTQCRTFPVWPENLKSPAAWDDAAASCPGMNRGRLYTSSEIARIRRGELGAEMA